MNANLSTNAIHARRRHHWLITTYHFFYTVASVCTYRFITGIFAPVTSLSLLVPLLFSIHHHPSRMIAFRPNETPYSLQMKQQHLKIVSFRAKLFDCLLKAYPKYGCLMVTNDRVLAVLTMVWRCQWWWRWRWKWRTFGVVYHLSSCTSSKIFELWAFQQNR